MAALLVMEGAMRSERLKPYWRLWAFPAPNPELAGQAQHKASSAKMVAMVSTYPKEYKHTL
jgi:hypothetical protein